MRLNEEKYSDLVKVLKNNKELFKQFFEDKYYEKLSPSGSPTETNWALKKAYKEGQVSVFKNLIGMLDTLK